MYTSYKNITATYLKLLDFFNFVEICAQTHKNLGAMGTEKVLYSLFVRWHFSKPFRLLQWGGILMKLAVCSDRSGDIDSDEIISIRDDAAR